MTQIIRFKDVEKLDKYELQKLGAQHSQILLDEGFVDAGVSTVQVKKAMVYLDAFLKGLDYSTRLQLTGDAEKETNIMGAKLSLSSTGNRLAYETDAEYMHIKKRLADRKGLLDLAFKSDDAIFNSIGEQVEKVKIKTHSKEILKVIL